MYTRILVGVDGSKESMKALREGISLAQILGEKGLELDSAIEIVSCVLTAFGLYFSFTGDAQGWFNA